ncbi:MAG: hypothetical protein U9O78_02455, partial [Patescibacteria group bacterium]|nr:hypothetical protein [Patescibacteria group bacterium]
NQAWKNNFLPIIVGGAGFYHLQLFNNNPDPYVKPNSEIRKKAEKLDVEQLQNWLKKENSNKFNKMNQSDQNNPRRLVRAIEVTKACKKLNDRIKNRPKFKAPKYYSVLGLKLPLDALEKNIKKRVMERFTHGAIPELKNLLTLKLDNNSAAMTATGVTKLINYLNNEASSSTTIQAWTQTEMQYAKRQITGWKKRKKIDWFNSVEDNFQQLVYQKIITELKL